MSRNQIKAIAVAAALTVAAAPVALADTVAAGSDVWKTDGSNSYVSFVGNPIPAGFFCTGSPAFSGSIDLTGKPLATSPTNALRGADTIVVRDQSATFDANGVAQVGGRLVALSLKGKSTLTTSCSSGSVTWNVLAYADDQSLPSSFTVIKSSGLGGTFSGTLRVPAVIRFTNADDSTDVRELDNDIDFTVPSDAEWTNQPGGDGWTSPQASVDTDADGTPDTTVPAASNFFPGKSPNPQPGCANPPCVVIIRHTAPQHAHFVIPPPKPCRVVIAPGPTTDTDTTADGNDTVEADDNRDIEASPSPSPSPVPCTTTTTTSF